MTRDEYGYPMERVTAERFHGPIELPSDATPAELVAHAAAYAAYQERFRVEYVAKVRRRSQRPPTDEGEAPRDRP